MLQLLLLTLILPNYSKPDPIPRNPSDSLSTLLLQTKTNPTTSISWPRTHTLTCILWISHMFLVTSLRIDILWAGNLTQ